MNQSVGNRIRPVARENGWGDPTSPSRSRGSLSRMEKDGYEIYFLDNTSFELTIRDPETMNREAVLTYESDNGESPSFVALIRYIIKNAENIVSECSTKQ